MLVGRVVGVAAYVMWGLTFYLKFALQVLWDWIVNARRRSFSDYLELFSRLALVWLVFIVLTQQATNYVAFLEARQEKFTLANGTVHDCAFLKTPSLEIGKVCADAKKVVKQSTHLQALSDLVNGWQTCIVMPCNEAISTIWNSFQLKAALVLIAFVIGRYFWIGGVKVGRWSQDRWRQKRIVMTRKAHKQSAEPDQAVYFCEPASVAGGGGEGMDTFLGGDDGDDDSY